jgi:hypothetical protein
MATSRTAKAGHRAEDVAVAIRSDLAEGNHPNAVYAAVGALMSELAKRRRHEPADAALLDAEIAGALAGIAYRLPKQRPQRPADYAGGVPTAEDLLAVFAQAYARANGKAGTK